ncbi:MAG: DUF1801 domain-containing protein [Steroidobacteraceae bacterium]|nr:DUF1801 domain-containing protein [Steroidobacteraceae bacterium]
MWSQYVSPAKTKAKANRGSSAVKRVNKAPKPAPRLRDLADWRTQMLERIRTLILEADPQIIEERKWRKASNPAGVPVFSRDGIVCTGERYQQTVKLTFANGASLPDPKKLFNAGLEGNLRRAIDIREGEAVDSAAFKALVKAAVARNVAAKKK